MEAASKPRLRILRVGDVAAQTGLSPATIYRLAQEDKFPRQVKLGDAAAGWLDHEIEAWLEARVQERDAMSAEEWERKTQAQRERVRRKR
ncbi:MAG TPA: AlpA family phage regulatory protein [Roseiarcus sp.]|jgi:prophage regulatory protein|nr:AlpA family phage regulatory protein [Roseiarcus sp.]